MLRPILKYYRLKISHGSSMYTSMPLQELEFIYLAQQESLCLVRRSML